MAAEKGKSLIITLLLGLTSAGLYGLLYLFAEPIIALSAKGHWMFIVPVGIAFLFSSVHGVFTGLFWDTLGIQAKK
ncbi:MAG: hypothetical protein WCP34_14025 [Pseudomonadota bacterium]